MNAPQGVVYECNLRGILRHGTNEINTEVMFADAADSMSWISTGQELFNILHDMSHVRSKFHAYEAVYGQSVENFATRLRLSQFGGTTVHGTRYDLKKPKKLGAVTCRPVKIDAMTTPLPENAPTDRPLAIVTYAQGHQFELPGGVLCRLITHLFTLRPDAPTPNMVLSPPTSITSPTQPDDTVLMTAAMAARDRVLLDPGTVLIELTALSPTQPEDGARLLVETASVLSPLVQWV
ncbi:hypothetical protein J8273_4360 [Carpediemonas membranifera]|uniref:Uncharacterized protein n=1 Tax=Carpediemonas membranifera TaxID=201153 RepID=A0A8J6AU55_9EUKA|nr:hypothetical protein J8273_4360 [Carpediemonas membranifera]|eukprot:KAG9394258.1 hypothetical protein J8273_4360 [Carpediemonas membranifera]